MKGVKIFFAGDFCCKPSTARVSVSDELRDLIGSCDIKVLTFEAPLKPEASHLPEQKRERFYQNDDAPAFLRGIGFNVFSIANNHTFDWGDEGYRKTRAALGKEAIGAGTYEEAYTVRILDVNGVKIGFLAVSFAAYTGVFDDVTRHDGLGCAYINDLRVNHVILAAKKEVDYLFVLPHDGIEYVDIPLPETVARYRDFIDYGADGVIGSHPHCPQGWEDYKGKPIFYSLGNFFFNSKDGYDYRATNRPHWYEGLCVTATITDEGLSWEVVNTLNTDNVMLSVDHDEKRDRYNVALCRSLADPTLYQEKLAACRSIAVKKDIPFIDHTFHDYGLKVTVRQLVKYVFKYLFNRPRGGSAELSYLLKNDTRRKLTERFL